VLDTIGVQHLVLGAILWLALNLVSLALVARIVVALPPDYFQQEPARRRWTLGRVGRNLAGIGLVLLGIVLSVPGVPGQGVLTVLAGLVLVDFPGRRRLERSLVGRRGILHALNSLRARFGRPPIRPPSG
jgi:hypothetical protein